MNNEDMSLGIRVKDVVSGLVGIVECHRETLSGLNQWQMTLQAKEGDTTFPAAQSIDATFLDFVDDGIKDRVRPSVDNSGIVLGDLVKDKITGFQGIVVEQNTFLDGCVLYDVEAKSLDKDGKRVHVNLLSPRWEHVATPEPVITKSKTGGPRREAAVR